MAIAFVSGTTKGTTTAAGRTNDGDLTVPLTAHSDGDLAIVTIYSDQGTASTPTGWTQIAGSPFGGGNEKLQIFWRFMQAGDTDPVFTITGSAAGKSHCGNVAVVSGVDTDEPFHAIGSASNSTGTPMTAPSITTTVANCVAVAVCGRGDNENASGQTFGGSATGVTELLDGGTAQGTLGSQVSAASKLIVSPGATGGASSTTQATDPWVSVITALRPERHQEADGASAGSTGGSVLGAAVGAALAAVVGSGVALAVGVGFALAVWNAAGSGVALGDGDHTGGGTVVQADGSAAGVGAASGSMASVAGGRGQSFPGGTSVRDFDGVAAGTCTVIGLGSGRPAPVVDVTWLPTPQVGPTAFRGALANGGSIPVGQKRWYRLVAMDATLVANVRRHSPASIEIGPFEATSTQRSVVLNWAANGGGTAAYRVYVRTENAGGVPNPTYSEITPNALGASATISFSTTTTATTFTDSVAAPVCTRPFFPVGIVRAVMTYGSVADPGTYRHFYDAVLAASPANCGLLLPASASPDITGPYFWLAAYLEFGEATSTTVYFAPKDSCVFVMGGLKSNIAVGSNSTILWGEYDPVTGRRSRGNAAYLGGYGTATRPNSTGVNRAIIYADALCELNDSYVEDIGRRGMIQVTGNGLLSGGSDPSVQVGNDGNNLPITLRGTELAGWNTNTNLAGQIVPAEVRDLFVRGCYAAYTYSVNNRTYDNLAVEDSTGGLFTRLPSGVTHRFVGLRVLGRTESDLILQSTSAIGHAILRDPTFGDAVDDEDPILRQVGAVVGTTVEWESLVQVQIIGPTGLPVSGASVVIRDVAGNILASGTTDASGVIVGGVPLSYLVYTAQTTGAQAAALMSAHVAAGRYTKSDKRPLTMTVLAAGLGPVVLPFSPTGSVAYRVMLPSGNAVGLVASVQRVEVAGTVGLAIVGTVDREDVGGHADVVTL